MKKAKLSKIFAAILALAVIALMTVPAFAAKSVNVRLDIAGAEGKVYVRLTAPANSDIATMSAQLNFDNSALAFAGMSYLTDDSIMSLTDDKRLEEGIVTANIILADSLTEKSKIFTYVFDVTNENAEKVSFEFLQIKATDSEDAPVAVKLNGKTEIALAELEPLSPDDTQSEFTKPTESKPESTTEAENVDKPDIPKTSGRIIAASITGVAVVSAVAGVSFYAVKKKKNEE